MTNQNDFRHRQNYVKKKIARWDMFAKIVPASILLLNLILLTFNYVDFHNAFWATLVLVSTLSCVWWVWTVATVKLVNKTLSQAENSLLDVKNDLKDIVKDVKNFQDRS